MPDLFQPDGRTGHGGPHRDYGQAAPYAGVMLLLAAVPSYVLGRWFDRLPARARSAQAPGPPPGTMVPV